MNLRKCKLTQWPIICSKLTIETLEEVVTIKTAIKQVNACWVTRSEVFERKKMQFVRVNEFEFFCPFDFPL